MAKTLQERLNCGEITVVEEGRETMTCSNGGMKVPGTYRILSDGRRQWRQLSGNGRTHNRFCDWQDS